MQRSQQQRALQRRSKLTTTKELERGAPAGTTGRGAPSPFTLVFTLVRVQELAVAVILNAHARPVALL